MVMTSKGSPDKHITPSQTQGPQATGKNYNAGNPNAPMDSASDAAAANIYGDPADATRMNRMKNIASEALDDTPDSTATPSYGEAFVQGNDWTLTPNKTVDENGLLPSVPAFPGDTASDSQFSYLGQPPNQGKDIGVPVATKGAPSVSNSGSPQFSGKGY
jgi:hypothetical protein